MDGPQRALVRATPVLVAVVVLLGLPHRASAAAPIDLSWQTPPGSSCPSQEDLLARLPARAAARGPVAPLAARGHVADMGAGEFELSLETTTEDAAGSKTTGVRRLRARGCAPLADAAVAVLAWMIDPAAGLSKAPRPPQAPPTLQLLAAHDANAAEQRPLHLGLWGAGAADRGTLPGSAFGAATRLLLESGRWGASLRAAFWPAVTAAAAGGSGGGRFTLGALSIDGCLLPGLVFLCAGPELTWVRGAGFGVEKAQVGHAAWLSFAGEIGLRVRLSQRVAWHLGGQVVLPTHRERFAIDGGAEIYRVEPALRGATGLAYALF